MFWQNSNALLLIFKTPSLKQARQHNNDHHPFMKYNYEDLLTKKVITKLLETLDLKYLTGEC